MTDSLETSHSINLSACEIPSVSRGNAFTLKEAIEFLPCVSH